MLGSFWIAASKYVIASCALPLARLAFADSMSWDTGVSAGISEGAIAAAKGAAERPNAPKATNDFRMIMVVNDVSVVRIRGW